MCAGKFATLSIFRISPEAEATERHRTGLRCFHQRWIYRQFVWFAPPNCFLDYHRDCERVPQVQRTPQPTNGRKLEFRAMNRIRNGLMLDLYTLVLPTLTCVASPTELCLKCNGNRNTEYYGRRYSDTACDSHPPSWIIHDDASIPENYRLTRVISENIDTNSLTTQSIETLKNGFNNWHCSF